MTLIDGKSISAKVKEEIKSDASDLAAKGVEPALEARTRLARPMSRARKKPAPPVGSDP